MYHGWFYKERRDIKERLQTRLFRAMLATMQQSNTAPSPREANSILDCHAEDSEILRCLKIVLSEEAGKTVQRHIFIQGRGSHAQVYVPESGATSSPMKRQRLPRPW